MVPRLPKEPTMTDTIEMPNAAQPTKTTSKSDTVIKLLGRGRGASLTEITEATAWQPHSVRAFLSNLRKRGKTLLKEERKNGERSYRIEKVANTPNAS